jgi:hypothetical protein
MLQWGLAIILELGAINDFKEIGDLATHSVVQVSLSALDVVVQVSAEIEELGSGIVELLPLKMARQQDYKIIKALRRHCL